MAASMTTCCREDKNQHYAPAACDMLRGSSCGGDSPREQAPHTPPQHNPNSQHPTAFLGQSAFAADSAASADSHQTLCGLHASSSADELQASHGLRTIRELQRGSSGVIMLAEEASNGGSVAVKLLSRETPNGAVSAEMLAQRSLLGNPHIVQFREAVLTTRHLAIVMEHARGGDLREYLERTRPASDDVGLPEDEARWFFQQIAIGVDYCHRLGIAHQDIKLENVVLDRRGPRALVKLCDFGFSVRNEADARAPVLCSRAVGTPDYMAPELLLSPTSYDGKAADVWACGVLLFTLLTGVFPFWRDVDVESSSDPTTRLRMIALRVVRADYKPPAHLSPAVVSLLARMLQPRPEERATMEEVMEDPWFVESLPVEARCLNERLMAMAPSQRCAGCPQSDTDLLRITRQMSNDRRQLLPDRKKRHVRHRLTTGGCTAHLFLEATCGHASLWLPWHMMAVHGTMEYETSAGFWREALLSEEYTDIVRPECSRPSEEGMSEVAVHEASAALAAWAEEGHVAGTCEAEHPLHLAAPGVCNCHGRASWDEEQLPEKIALPIIIAIFGGGAPYEDHCPRPYIASQQGKLWGAALRLLLVAGYYIALPLVW
eukprot:CAMPEP_0206136050 /NCGR_PEP_ID=MMETSP1473-20131121/1287_1 /ASSEMBLY_ACC=CAM_ASM_001109 /TAXON_ID=1461547 /ORGANISM="Stichococcus sp, Strain RCC1054" /LENGTH=603 /DNA_ID=CAMNT_0053528287 /DNA_START=12 /DNA_END=1823 /DNA_ORIENTATION=+